MPTYTDYLTLNKGESPPRDPHEDNVRIYADEEGVLHLLQSDGTDSDLGAGGGGGSQTVEVATDPDTFVGTHVFDLGGPAACSCVLTVIAADGDGETFGEGDGEISGTSFLKMSADGATADQTQIRGTQVSPPQLVSVDDTTGALVGVTSRYVIVEVDIDRAPDFELYAGENHPTITVRAAITY